MRNAEEHARLLAQIAELEKNSVNYFDVEKEFFLIDSNNLAEVKTRLYGYSIQATGIYEEDNLTEEAVAGLDGRGCYVYVENRDGHITIKQDLNGCWGIYLFRHGDYFALSNSFFRLLDHIKFKYPLTVNRDYCQHLIIGNLVSHAYSETSVNEVFHIERNAILNISVVEKNLEVELINYQEYTISINSPEGVDTLDRWIEFWGYILRGIQQHTPFITSDLSGGFDSRSSLLIALNSGIDLNKINIHSIIGDVITYKEDYEIASKISSYYGFKLNRPLPKQKFLNYTLNDMFNKYIYTCGTFHKYFDTFSTQKNIDKLYVLTGFSGETFRGYWYKSPKEWLEERVIKAEMHSLTSFNKLITSLKSIFKSGFRAVCGKYRIKDRDSPHIPQYFYQEVRSRNHYGKLMANNYLSGKILLSPAMDPQLRTLQLDTPECPDPKLLLALMYTRYEPDLLKFPFDSKRFIAPQTIEYANKINARFPRRSVINENKHVYGGGYLIYNLVICKLKKFLFRVITM